MRIGITGATGYIGSQLIKRLSNHSIRGFVRESSDTGILEGRAVTIVKGDLTDSNSLTHFVNGLDVVIHCAAALGKGPWSKFWSVNTEATRQLCTLSQHAGVGRLVYISTIEVYGRFAGRMLTEDITPRLCGNEYADSKLLAEVALWEELTNGPMNGVVVRPGMVFGPGATFWTKRLYDLARTDELVLIDGGKGAVFPVFIDDLIDGIILCLHHDAAANETFNFANDEPLTWNQWALDHMRICNKGESHIKYLSSDQFLIQRNNRMLPSRHLEVMTRKGTVSNLKATNLLGWKARIGYREGMRRSKEWLDSVT